MCPGLHGALVLASAQEGAATYRARAQNCDNGTEFVSAAMDQWAYANGVALDFSRRGKPTDNAAIESFNGRFREECLNVHWFTSLDDAAMKIETWRQDYNATRPHRALKGLSPDEYARRASSEAADSPS